MKSFLLQIISAPARYQGQRRETARTVKTLLVLLPIPLVILIAERLARNDIQGALLILMALLISSLSIVILNKGFLDGSVIFLCSVLLVLVTTNATRLSGIHNLTIISYPTIIVFSSLIVKRRYMGIFLVLTILAILWLGGGEEMGYFKTEPWESGHPADLISIFIILLLGLLPTSDLVKNLRDSSLQSNYALAETDKSNTELQSTIHQKNELIKEVHVQAKTNIDYIHKLFKSRGDDFDNLGNRIRAIYHAHDTPFVSGNPELIDFKEYTSAYFADLTESLSLEANQLEVQFSELKIPVDKVNSLGICFYELIRFSVTNSANAQILFEFMDEDRDELRFKISAYDLATLPESRILFDITIRQLKADFSLSDDHKIGVLTLPKNKS